ncbi:MAG: hypothetical protein LBG46_02575 [Elusimicrobiota bacterium]|nr:hypothetical protein [Elusimicrobiota bacterium]
MTILDGQQYLWFVRRNFPAADSGYGGAGTNAGATDADGRQAEELKKDDVVEAEVVDGK